MAYGYIYKIVNEINGKVYIGQTTQLPNLRWNAHKTRANAKCKNYKNMAITCALIAHGVSAFSFKVICRADSQQELNTREVAAIRLFNSLSPHGYNIRGGGGAGGHLQDETKQKISRANKGLGVGRKLSKEHRLKISQRLLARRYKVPRDIVQRVAEAKYRPVIGLHGNLVYRFASRKAASLFTKVSQSSISNILAGRTKLTYSGWFFKGYCSGK